MELKPIYIEAAKILENDLDGLYMFAEINAYNQVTLTNHFQIEGLPTILSFSPLNDYIPTRFDKERTVFNLVSELEIAAGLSSIEVSTYEDLNARISSRDENIIVGIFKDEKNVLYKEMKEAKEEFKFIRMYYTFNIKEHREKLNLGNEDGFILMFHNKKFLEEGDSAFEIYKIDKYKTIRDFIIEEYPYCIDYMNDKLNSIYSIRHRPNAVLFTPFTNRSMEVLNLALQMKPLATKFKGKFNIYLDDDKSELGRLYRLQENTTYMIFDTDLDESKYRYTSQTFNNTIDVNALIEFTELFLEGKLPKHIRSAEYNDDDLLLPIITLTANTYDSVVKDPTKHVFVRFYNKMLQRFNEHYDMRIQWYEVGRYFLNTSRDDIVIAEIETKDNDVPKYFLKEMDENDHYFFLFMKDNKNKPIPFTKKVVTKQLIKFAEEHIGKPNDVLKEDL